MALSSSMGDRYHWTMKRKRPPPFKTKTAHTCPRPDIKECLCDSTHVTLRQRCGVGDTTDLVVTRHDMRGARSQLHGRRELGPLGKAPVPWSSCVTTGDEAVSLKCWPPSYACGADLHTQ